VAGRTLIPFRAARAAPQHPPEPRLLVPRTTDEQRRSNLPLQLTSFVGREQVLEERARILAQSRLLTLTGPPGVGKTRLALQLAGQVADAYADGVWLVELAPLVDRALVPQTVAQVLGAQESRERELLDTLPEALHAKQLLLVLDTCEHLIDACAALADRLLRSCPDVQILATSREALGIAGERAWSVPALGVPVVAASTTPDVTALGECEAVRLFVERAAAAVPGFALTEHNATSVARICRRLDGIALALELAAARLRALSVEQLAARLDAALPGVGPPDDRFRLLAAGSRVASPRQQTLRAALDWSYALLSEPERMLLRRLAVFGGSWSLEAAEQVCAGDGLASDLVLDLVVQLVSKSLVLIEALADERRYRLLDMIREYAHERLYAAGEDVAVRHRHLEWMADLADQAPTFLRGPEEMVWLVRFERELDSIRTALSWGQGQPAEAATALGLAARTWSFWYRTGRITEGRAWLERGLASSERSAPAAVLAIFGAAALTHVQGDTERAQVLAVEGLALSRERGDAQGIGLFLFAEARLAQGHGGDRARAVALTQQSLQVFREAGDRIGIAIALGGLGLLAQERGDFAEAAAQFEEVLTLYRELGDTYGIGWSLHYLGWAWHALGVQERALSLLQDSLRLRREIDDSEGIAGCLEGLAAVAAARGQAGRTARLLGAADALRLAIGTPLPATEGAPHDRARAVAADRLGAEVFATTWAEAQTWTLEQVTAYALEAEEAGTAGTAGTPVQAPARPAIRTPASGGLSRRERDVAALIARGHTNREIAARLVISEWTVDTHVRHILTKLNFRSRAQVAAWANSQGLLADEPG
jgi:non-specific serine/threonine protein kinase